MKKDCWMRKKKEAKRHHENSQAANIASTIVQDALILSLGNINDAWVVDSRVSFYTTPIGNISKTMSKVTLDMCIG